MGVVRVKDGRIARDIGLEAVYHQASSFIIARNVPVIVKLRDLETLLPFPQPHVTLITASVVMAVWIAREEPAGTKETKVRLALEANHVVATMRLFAPSAA